MPDIPFYPLDPDTIELHLKVNDLAREKGIGYWLQCSILGFPVRKPKWYAVAHAGDFKHVGLSKHTAGEALTDLLNSLNNQKEPIMALTKIKIATSLGDIIAVLNGDKAPKTVANFLEYLNAGHYNSTIFHRVIKGFMIQGGGFDADMKQKPAEKTVENEARNQLKNNKYSLAMARTSAPHSASAQFFINTKNNGFLDYPGQDGWGYAVFGEVIEGQNVVDAIESVQTGRVSMFADVPKEPVVITSIEVLENEPEAA